MQMNDELVNKLIKEQRITNSMLRLLIKQNVQKYYLPNNLEKLINHSFSLVHDDFAKVKLFVETLAAKTGNKVIVLKSSEKPHVAADISSAVEGDYILVNNDNIISSDELIDVLLQAFKHKEIRFTVGKGASATNVTLDVYNLNYVIYSDVEALIPAEILAAFPIANPNKIN